MNYIGSKLSLLEFIEASIDEVVGKGVDYTFCDLFAGTGAVGTHFKKKGHRVIANDIQYYSYVLNRHYIANHRELEFEQLFGVVPSLDQVDISRRKVAVCDYLQELEGVEGFVFKNYCPQGLEGDRLYFTAENGKKCDAIRQRIEEWRNESLVSDDEYYFLLTSLLESIDKYANTASVYGAFLKKFKKTALRPLKLLPAKLHINDNEHEVYNKDANKVIAEISPDVLYLDPPYNTRQYSANYHVLETVAKYDNPSIRGKTGLRDYSDQKSLYCSRAKVKAAFADLINNAKVKYIFLSYNNEGLLSPDDIEEVMGKRGEYGVFKQEYPRFKADSGRDYSADKTVEYLHYVICH